MNSKILSDYGIDYNKGLARCMDDEDFYMSVLSAFLEDDTFSRAQEAFDLKDYAKLFNCVHELKGVSGNAAMTDLYNEDCELVELLRHNTGTEDEISEHFSKLKKAYIRVSEGVTQALNG